MYPGLPSRPGQYRGRQMRPRGEALARDRSFAGAVGSTSSGFGDMEHSGTNA